MGTRASKAAMCGKYARQKRRTARGGKDKSCKDLALTAARQRYALPDSLYVWKHFFRAARCFSLN